MTTHIRTLMAGTAALIFLAGCASTADLAKHESSTCEVHKCAMTVQVVDCSGGYSGYDTQFNFAMLSSFPHHGRLHYSEDHAYIYARHLRIHVCHRCTEAYDQWKAEHRQIGQDSDVSFAVFWRSFQSALKEKDVAAISRMTRFPLDGGLEELEGFSGIDTKEGFMRHFETLFPDDAIRTLTAKMPDPEALASGGPAISTKAWSIAYTTKISMGEGEWTDSARIYKFTRLDDGQIKLTSIVIAG